MEGLAELSKFRGGKWVVDHKGAEIALSDTGGIEEAMKDGLLDAPKTEKDALLTIAQNTMNLDEMTAAIKESIEFKAAAESQIYERSMEVLKPGIVHFEERATASLDLVMETMNKGVGGIGGVIERSLGSPDSGDNVITKAVDKTFGTFNKAIEEQLMEGGINPETMLVNASGKIIINGTLDEKEDVYLNSGNSTIVSGPAGTFKLHDQDQYAVGAGGSLLAGTELLGNGLNNVGNKGGGSSTVNVNGEITVKSTDGQPIGSVTAQQLMPMIMQQLNGGPGIPTSNKEKMTGTR